jgi:hypothetical protein
MAEESREVRAAAETLSALPPAIKPRPELVATPEEMRLYSRYYADYLARRAARPARETPTAELAPRPSGELAPRPSGELAPRPSGELAPRPSGELAPRPSGELAPRPSGELAPRPSGELAPRPSGELAPRPSGELAPRPSSELAPRPSGELAPRPSGELAPAAAPRRTSAPRRAPPTQAEPAPAERAPPIRAAPAAERAPPIRAAPAAEHAPPPAGPLDPFDFFAHEGEREELSRCFRGLELVLRLAIWLKELNPQLRRDYAASPDKCAFLREATRLDWARLDVGQLLLDWYRHFDSAKTNTAALGRLREAWRGRESVLFGCLYRQYVDPAWDMFTLLGP